MRSFARGVAEVLIKTCSGLLLLRIVGRCNELQLLLLMSVGRLKMRRQLDIIVKVTIRIK
jgi:hypothetical protein